MNIAFTNLSIGFALNVLFSIILYYPQKFHMQLFQHTRFMRFTMQAHITAKWVDGMDCFNSISEYYLPTSVNLHR